MSHNLPPIPVPTQWTSPWEKIAEVLGIPAPRDPEPPISVVDAAVTEAQAEPPKARGPKRGRHAAPPVASPARKVARAVIPKPVRAAVRDKLRIQSAQ